MSDDVLNRYIKNNLDVWQNEKLDEDKLINIIKKYNLSIVKIQIKNKQVKILKNYQPKKGKKKLNKSITFLNDVCKVYPNLNIILYLNVSDTLYHEEINIFNVNGKKENPHKLNDFEWGYSKSNPNYIKIVDSKCIQEYNKSFPIFCFEKK